MQTALPILLALSVLSGCASIVSSATSKMADNITLAILNQDDPATVRDGAPAYLLMIDGLIEGDPENDNLLLAGTRLYGSYTTAFIEDEARAKRLAEKSLAYARRALCLEVEVVCAAAGGKYEQFTGSLAQTGPGELPVLYAFATAWVTWIQVNASDWNALADLAKVTALFERCVEIDESVDGGGAHVYLGVIKSLRPAALGGEPESARQHFERALEISAGRNLMISVLMARHYARNVFDRELHDALLTSVKMANADYAGYTLINTLAKVEADKLLAESNDFF
ncbi:MAG: TRAP transporter TatT component family protein [Gammaproteobacteria bacterium]|nr:TRAP transporter TatT component family protein [Gammaproteobacteria bacterium]MDH3450733.1 TRAP transporter TatT component family protein [Gammaproteobacteria bacterium]